MKILVISDTHGHAGRLWDVLNRTGQVDALIHCGDVEGQEDEIRDLADCPCYMVTGNNDWDSVLPDEITATIDDYRIWITHGHRYGVSLGPEMLRDEAESKGIDLCFFGHTHRPMVETENNLTLINPGSLTYPRQLGRKPTYVLITIDRDHGLHFEICELKK
ncbi:MAG: metallophosphoesterase [Eubacterium sp.]|nr:metallophosphoesterase [Eubacterium sp.]